MWQCEVRFDVLGQPAIAIQPSEGSFHDPSARQQLEASDSIGLPRIPITDKLASYSAAKRELMPSVERRQHKGPTTGQKIYISQRSGESGR